jgi:hypothetical protein
MRDVGGILIPLGAFTMICWIVYTVVNGARRWYQQRTVGQFQAKLLDRIGSVNELGAFLNTEAGGRFLRGLTTLNESEVGPQVRILRAVQAGAVLATLGTGLYLYGWLTPTVRGEVTNVINALATILFGIGAGFLGSAALSYRLSKQMGLLPSNEPRRDESASSIV